MTLAANIDTKLAQTFLLACQSGSMRAAAEVLGIEPSSVSRQIAQLEATLAIALLERGRRGVQATEAGKLLLQYLHNQKIELETVMSEFDALRGLRRGQIDIALGDGFISDFIGNALAEFSATFPGVSYRLQSGSTAFVEHQIREDLAHFGLAYNARLDQGLQAKARAGQPLDLLVAPETDWAALPEPVSVRTLGQIPLALLLPGFGIGALVRDAESHHSIRFQAIVESNSIAVLRNFVRAGIGGTILPAFVVTSELADGSITRKSIDLPEFGAADATLMVRSGRPLPEITLKLIQHLIRKMNAFEVNDTDLSLRQMQR
jgi:DNA-binding transcriptional LysR family regulator